MLGSGPVWGIDIADSAIKAVKLKRSGSQIVLQDFHIIRFSDINGEAGARREGLLPQGIAALQAAGFRRENCVISIPPQSVLSKFVNLPPVEKKRVPEIVLYEARQQIPFSLNEVIWAYEMVRKDFVPGEEIEIGLFAVKRETIYGYLSELMPIWKRLQGIQVGPLALYNYVRHDVQLDKPLIILDIGAQSTDLLIIDGPKFWLRNLPIAGNSFTSVLEKRLNIPRVEAEKLKLEVADSRHRRKLLEVLRPVMRDLVAEVQRSIGYYKSLSQDVKFEEILVMGEGYKLFGLDRFLAEQLQYKITPINQLRNISYNGDPARKAELENALPSLAVAMGLALQGLGKSTISINLLPEEFVIRRTLQKKRFSGLVAAALVWAIVGSFYMREQRLSAAANSMTGMGDKTIQDVKTMNDKLGSVSQSPDQPRIDMYQAFGKNRMFNARVIGAICNANVIPNSIQIDGGFEFVNTPGVATPAETELLSPHTPYGYEAAQAKDVEIMAASPLKVIFSVSSDASNEWPTLGYKFPQAVRRAVMMPEDVPLIKAMLVGPISTRPNPRTNSTDMFADVALAINSSDEIAALSVARKQQMVAEEKAKAEKEKAAKEAAAAAAAAKAAPPAAAGAKIPAGAPAGGNKK